MMKTKTMIKTESGRSSGFTMVELLIAIIIIGILVAIIVPVLSNRAADARIAAAKADMEAIANAESQVALDTGYLVRLHVLDDSGAAGDTPPAGSNNINDVVDTIREEDLNNSGNPGQIFLDAKTGILMPLNLFTRVQADPEGFGWRGPYVNYQRKLKMPTVPAFTWTYGSPLDPWGNPYFLFVAGEDLNSGTSSNGLWVNEPAGTLDPTFSYGGFTADARVFDRPTVVSLGANGQPGDASNPILGAGDDLIRAF